MSALTAIFHHGVTGEGQFIDVSMHAAANITTEMSSYFYLIEQQTVIRQTGRHAMPMMTMPVQIACADGRYATTGMPPRTPKGFGDLYDWMERLELTAELPESIFLDTARHRESISFADIGVDDEVTAAFAAARSAAPYGDAFVAIFGLPTSIMRVYLHQSEGLKALAGQAH